MLGKYIKVIAVLFLFINNICAQPFNVNTTIVWSSQDQLYRVFLQNGSGPQTISFSGFNMDFDAPNGTSLVIQTNPYNIILDNPSAGAGEVFTFAKTSPTAGVSFPAEPLLILELGVSGPNDINQVVLSNNYVELAGVDRTGFIALPITLKSFDAIKLSASSAKLDWTTSKEVNSDYFGIERSIDGSTWDEIARVKAAGDSNVDIAYDYIDDRLPLSRTNGQVFYYRLRMTDLDGAFKYSDVRGVNFDKQALGPISIYPNPTTEIVNIDLSEVVMEDGDVYVSVYDMSGRLVMTKQIIGSGIELIKVDQLPSDAYNFIIRQGEQIHQQRVIKID